MASLAPYGVRKEMKVLAPDLRTSLIASPPPSMPAILSSLASSDKSTKTTSVALYVGQSWLHRFLDLFPFACGPPSVYSLSVPSQLRLQRLCGFPELLHHLPTPLVEDIARVVDDGNAVRRQAGHGSRDQVLDG